MAAWLGVIAAALGIVLLILRRRKPETKLDRAKKVVSRARANVEKSRSDLQKRDMEALEKDLDRQSDALDSLRGVLPEVDKTPR